MNLFSFLGKSQPIHSFTQYRENKGKEWKNRVSKTKSKDIKEKEVIIFIGRLAWSEKSKSLKPSKGKRIALKVLTTDKAITIRIKAEQKWKDYHPELYDQDLYYKLVYESGIEITTLPGTSEPFNLHKYKEEIGKDYKRMTFYLCSENDLEVSSKMIDFDSELSNESPPRKLLKLEDMDNGEVLFQDDIDGENVSQCNSLIDSHTPTPFQPPPTFQTPPTFQSSPLPSNSSASAVHPPPSIEFNPDTSPSTDFSFTPTTSKQCNSVEDIVIALSREVITTESFFFVIRRNSDVTRILKTWKLHAKVESPLKKLMVHFSAELGIDDGALKKEFLQRAIRAIGANLFPDGAPLDSMLHVQNGDFKACGQIVSVSIAQGGPPPSFLHENVYKMMVNPEVDLQKVSSSMLIEKEQEHIEKVLSSPNNYSDYIIDSGYTGLISETNVSDIRGTIVASIVSRRICYLKEFVSGMLFGLKEFLFKEQDLCKILFRQAKLEISIAYIASILRPVYSEEHSTRRQVEEMVMDLFQDFLFEVEEGNFLTHLEAPIAYTEDDENGTETENVNLTPKSIVSWITGQQHRPLDGSELEIIVNFEHDCYDKYPEHRICFPVVRACTNEITLPVAHMKNPNNFQEVFTKAFQNGQSFSRR